jgi:hypothetical protein
VLTHACDTALTFPSNADIEGIIDGGTRKVLALHAVDNKFATTMGSFVIDAVINFGVPHKLRTDCGTENVDMERYAALLRYAGYKIKYLKGPSFVLALAHRRCSCSPARH